MNLSLHSHGTRVTRAETDLSNEALNIFVHQSNIKRHNDTSSVCKILSLPISFSPILHSCFSVKSVTKSVLLRNVPRIKIEGGTYRFCGYHLFLCAAKRSRAIRFWNLQHKVNTYFFQIAKSYCILLILPDSRQSLPPVSILWLVTCKNITIS